MTITVPVKNREGKVVGDLELNPKIFGVPTKTHVIHEAVRAERANRRVAIAHTKTRGEVRGGGKKPWKQKGTGRARHGSSRSPIWIGGGITFGPRSDRNFSLKINKKTKKLACAMALSEKVRAGTLTVLDAFAADAFKTKVVAGMLKSVGLGNAKILLVLPGPDEKTRYSARNIPRVTVLNANNLSITTLLDNPNLLTTRDGIKAIEKIWSPSGTN